MKIRNSMLDTLMIWVAKTLALAHTRTVMPTLLQLLGQKEDESENRDIQYGDAKVDVSTNEVNVTNERNGRMDGWMDGRTTKYIAKTICMKNKMKSDDC